MPGVGLGGCVVAMLACVCVCVCVVHDEVA